MTRSEVEGTPGYKHREATRGDTHGPTMSRLRRTIWGPVCASGAKGNSNSRTRIAVGMGIEAPYPWTEEWSTHLNRLHSRQPRQASVHQPCCSDEFRSTEMGMVDAHHCIPPCTTGLKDAGQFAVVALVKKLDTYTRMPSSFVSFVSRGILVSCRNV